MGGCYLRNMKKRIVLGAFHVLLFFLFIAFIWEGVLYLVRLHDPMMRVTLPRHNSVDLETGEVASRIMSNYDLMWMIKTNLELCLCPMFGSNVLIAKIPENDFDIIDAPGLAMLDYSNKGFRYSDKIKSVHRGLSLAVLTEEGNLGKVRVINFVMDNRLDIEWKVFPPAIPPSGDLSVQLYEIKTTIRKILHKANKFSILEKAFLLYFLFIGGLFIFAVAGTIFSPRKTTGKSYWDALFTHALKNNATNLRFEVGKPLQMKINNEWQNINMPPFNNDELDRLKSILQSQSNIWMMDGIVSGEVVQNEGHTIEFELKSEGFRTRS